MKLKEKIAIMILSVTITLVGFNFIASQAVDIMRVGKAAGYEIIANTLDTNKHIG